MVNDLNLLKTFYYVALEESVSKAAVKLHISQPAVSQNIKQLELEIGFALFVRTNKGVKLTNEGKEIYSYCNNIFKQIDLLNQTLQDLSTLEAGILNIGASDTICKYYLIDILKQFEELYPKIRYRVTNCTTSESLNLLKRHDVDIAFVHTPVPDNELNFVNCLKLNDVFVCSYDFDDSKINCLEDLTKYRILLLEDSSHSRRVLDNNLMKYNIKLKPKFELASLDLLIEFCKKNMGIICVSKQYIEKELKNKELKIINIKEKLDSRYISLVYDDEYISNAAKKLLEFINNKLEQ
jgi:DNA-binding transcriptional LysR family regulator